MTKWEYSVSLHVQYNADKGNSLNEDLNARGKTGWELISLDQVGGNFDMVTYRVVWKRQIKTGKE